MCDQPQTPPSFHAQEWSIVGHVQDTTPARGVKRVHGPPSHGDSSDGDDAGRITASHRPALRAKATVSMSALGISTMQS
jgi:hypothetical protein